MSSSKIFNFIKSIIPKKNSKSKSKSKTPSPPKTPSPKSKTQKKSPTGKSILKKTVSNITKKHSKEKKTDSPSVIKWGENEIKEISPRTALSPDQDDNLIKECTKKRPKKEDLPCKLNGIIIRNKKDYIAHVLRNIRHCDDSSGSIKFPCNKNGVLIKTMDEYNKYKNEVSDIDAFIQDQKSDKKIFTKKNIGKPRDQILYSLNKKI